MREKAKGERTLRQITLAGGCFWGTEAYFSRLKGVQSTECGYTGGNTVEPDYKAVCTGGTGYAEAVRVVYDPSMISLDRLLAEFFKTIDPTTKNRQGADRGTQYRSGIYYSLEEDLPVIRSAVADAQKGYNAPIVTEVQPLACFYRAEEYHQKYLEKNPGGYCHVDLSLLPQEGSHEI